MLKHNLLIIFRNFARSKSTFFINLIGLSTGLACALLIYLWVNDELHVDKFNENDSQLYQVMENNQQENGILTLDGTAGLVSETLKEDFPDVEYAVQVAPEKWFTELGDFNLSSEHNNLKAAGQFAGKDFFNVFSYNLLQGNSNQVLSEKNSIVISESLAKRIFNTTENIIGKTLEWHLLHFKQTAVISGIFKDVPSNSSHKFDFVLPFEKFKEIDPDVVHWGNYGTNAYVVLKKGADVNQFNKKIADLVKKKNGGDFRTLFLRPFSAGYLYGKYENGIQSGGRIEYVKLFSLIAIFILLIACINFMNLSTAKASVRMKEIGVKKTIGASRKTLVAQYLGESIVMSVFSMLISLILVELFIPQFNNITGKQLSLHWNVSIILPLLIITIFTGILSGSYPAIYLSGFKPVSILRGTLKSSTNEIWLRKGLVIFQFTLSVILIVSVIVVYKQIEFIRNKNLGYNKENIIQFANEGEATENAETFVSEIKKLPGIINATSTYSPIMGIQSTTVGLNWEGKDKNSVVQFLNMSSDFSFIETMGLKIKEGRNFSKDYGNENDKIIFNETAIKIMGLKDPIGKTVNLWGKNMRIIGVVKDFNIESLHEKIKPLFIKLPNGFPSFIIARIRAGEESEAIQNLQKLYEKFNPGYTFDFKFLDQDYQSLYNAEERTSTLSKYFAGIAILISCLGLLGLTSFANQRRVKEIGIRKILGSSEFGIVYLLSTDFTKLLFTSLIIALPVSYYLIKNWLDSFAYRIDLSPWYFVSAGLITLIIAWLTVGIQAVKAASVNPVESLKYE